MNTIAKHTRHFIEKKINMLFYLKAHTSLLEASINGKSWEVKGLLKLPGINLDYQDKV